MRLDQLIDKCDLYRSLYKGSATTMRKDEYYEKWKYYQGLLREHAKENEYKVQLYFKPEPSPIPMHEWQERFEEYGD
jgi:hypothetical protein